jgi:hypothetical protein
MPCGSTGAGSVKGLCSFSLSGYVSALAGLTEKLNTMNVKVTAGEPVTLVDREWNTHKLIPMKSRVGVVIGYCDGPIVGEEMLKRWNLADEMREALTDLLRHCVTPKGMPDVGKGRTPEQQAALTRANLLLDALKR